MSGPAKVTAVSIGRVAKNYVDRFPRKLFYDELVEGMRPIHYYHHWGMAPLAIINILAAGFGTWYCCRLLYNCPDVEVAQHKNGTMVDQPLTFQARGWSNVDYSTMHQQEARRAVGEMRAQKILHLAWRLQTSDTDVSM